MLVKHFYFAVLSSLFLFSCDRTSKPDVHVYEQLIQKKVKGETFQNSDDKRDSKVVHENIEVLEKAIALVKQKQHGELTQGVFLKQINLLYDALQNPVISLSVKAWIYSYIGFYFYAENEYVQAAPYFIELSLLIENQLEELSLGKEDILLNTAFFFQTLEEYRLAQEYFSLILNLPLLEDTTAATVYFNLGELAYRQVNYVKAKEYYLKSQGFALDTKDTLRYAKTLGGLGQIDMKEGRMKSARELLEKDFVLSSHVGDVKNMMYSRLLLGQGLFENNQIDSAFTALEEAYAYAFKIGGEVGYEFEILSFLKQIAQLKKEDSLELYYSREVDKIAPIAKEKEGELAIQLVNGKLNYHKILWDLELKKAKVESLWYQRIVLFLVVSFLCLLLLGVYLFFKRRNKMQAFAYQTKLMHFELARIKSEDRLHKAENTLSAHQQFLSEKTTQIAQLEEELQALKKSSSTYLKHNTPAIQELLQSHLMTEENWDLFKLAFYKEQKQYVDYLQKHFADLTESNLRIVLLQKIGLSKEQIANLLGITSEAVRKANQRLKKKYGEKYHLL